MMLGLVIWAGSHFIHVSNCPTRTTEIAANLHAVSLALERYAVDNGHYPTQIEMLQAELYMPSWPRNTLADYSAATGSGESIKMQPLALDAPAVPGDFVYIPEYRRVDDKLTPIGYELYAYGNEELKPGQQLAALAGGIDPRYAFFRIRQRGRNAVPDAERVGTRSSRRKLDSA